MLVHQILKSKGDISVFTVTPGTIVSDAVQLLAEKRIGGLVVSRDGVSVDGIISERDIVRSLALRGPVCLTETVGDMMTRNPSCCGRGDSADDVLARMTDGRFRHMPVIEDGKLCGMLTIGDVVNYRLNELEYEALQLKQMIVG